MKFILTKKDCLEFETVINAKYKWGTDANVTLYEGAQQIWYESTQFDGLVLHRELTEEEEHWCGYYHSEERSRRVQGEYLIGEDGFILSDENVNELLKKVEEFVDKNKEEFGLENETAC